MWFYILDNSFTSPDDPEKINLEKNTNLEDLDGIPIVYQVKYEHIYYSSLLKF